MTPILDREGRGLMSENVVVRSIPTDPRRLPFKPATAGDRC